jgi:AcrR family transcriptional regulator
MGTTANRKGSSATDPPRKRRATHELRRRILTSASELFAEKGFSGVSTREIAKQANVTERQIYRYYSSKAVLFEEAVAEPITGFITDYVEQWDESRPETSTEYQSLKYAGGLYDLLRNYRGQMLALIAAHAYEEDLVNTTSAISPLLDRLSEVVEIERDAYGWEALDTPITIRAAFSMILGLALFDSWLFPPGSRRPSRQRIVSELALFIAAGTSGRHGQSIPAAQRKTSGADHGRSASRGRNGPRAAQR